MISEILALCSELCPVLMFRLVEESSYDRYLTEDVGMDTSVTQQSDERGTFSSRVPCTGKATGQLKHASKKIQSKSPSILSTVCVLSYFVTYISTSTHISNI
jgi:hypothetical protein